MKSILLYEDGKAAVAAWLERDILAQGPTGWIALERLYRTILATTWGDLEDGRQPFERRDPAPDVYHQMYGRAEPWSRDLPEGCDDWEVRYSVEPSPFVWKQVGNKMRVVPRRCNDEEMLTNAADQRASIWKSYRETSLQQFNRSRGVAARDVILVLDPSEEMAVDLARVTYKAALKDPDSGETPDAEMETLALIGAPYVLILPADTAKAALEGLFSSAIVALSSPPEHGKVRVLVIQGTECTSLTDDLLRTKKIAN